MNKFKAGFTLIEMLIVIAIIAILSSVFLVGLTGFRSGAYDSRRISDLQKAQSYLEVYYNGNRSYPVNATMPNKWMDLKTTLSVSSLPDDPIASQHYVYCVDDSGQNYLLAAKLTKENPDSYKEGDITGYSCTSDGGAPDCSAGSQWFCIKL